MRFLDKKIFIFDMDGVIVNSNKVKSKSFALALKEFGVSVKDEEIMEYMGMSRWGIAKKLIEKYKLNISIDELVSKRMKILEELRNEIELFPCALDLLLLLKKLGKTLVLATSSDRLSIEKELDKNVIELFDRIVSSDDVKEAKPNPEIFIRAMGDARPEDCVVIEDSPYGIMAAKKVGLYCIGVLNNYRKREDLIKAGADIIFNDICELYNHILKEAEGV